MSIRQSFVDARDFISDSRRELSKVTWPDRQQLQQATIAIIIFVMIVGAIIAILDVTLQALLVDLLPRLFQ